MRCHNFCVAVAAKMRANATYIYSFLQICNLSEVMVAVAAKMCANAIYKSLRSTNM